MNIFLRGGIIMLALGAFGSLKAQITSTSSFFQIIETLDQVCEKEAKENILIAFDIDMTLTQPDHPAVCYPTLRKYITSYKNILKHLSAEKKDLVSTRISQELPQKLVDVSAPKIIKKLQSQGFKLMAFTASLTGYLKGRSKSEELKFKNLKKKGIDFSSSFGVQEIVFRDTPSYNGNHPVFYKGILFTNGEKGPESKGSILIAFLKKMKIKPKVIMMVDDKKKNLEDIEEFLHGYDPSIVFIGFEYGGAFSYVPQEISETEFQRFWKNFLKSL